MKIKMKSIGSMMSDCTTNYQLVFDAECTVRDIVEFALSKKGEWGSIRIQTPEEVTLSDGLVIHRAKDITELNYAYGELKSDPLLEDILNRQVFWCYANGGYSCMGYTVTI